MENKTKTDHNPLIVSARCPTKNCGKKTTHLLYFLVGPNLDIKSFYGALCETHAIKTKEDYSQFRECVIISIEETNKKIQENLDKQNENK